MPHITTNLGNEVGIQNNGIVVDANEIDNYVVTGLIVGIFKRGRFDRPMTITLDNIRSVLGFDPKNRAYMAIIDTLNSGIPSVQVLRIRVFEEIFNPALDNETIFIFELSYMDLMSKSIVYDGSARYAVIASRTLDYDSQGLIRRLSDGTYNDDGTFILCPSALLEEPLNKQNTILTLKEITDIQDIELNSLCIIGNEKMFIIDLNLEQNKITVKRGADYTLPYHHDIDERIYFYSKHFNIANSLLNQDDSITVKGLIKTNSETLNLENATEYYYSFNALSERPLPPGNVKINGEYEPQTIDENVVITWTHRNRLEQTVDDLIGWYDGDFSLEDSTIYHIKIQEFDEDSELLKTQNLNLGGASTYTFQISQMQKTTHTIQFSLKTIRDESECAQIFNHTVESIYFSSPYNITHNINIMSNDINFSFDVDGKIELIKYYNSNSSINIDALPTPKDMLNYNDRTYTDENLDAGKYYIIFSSVKNNTEKLSQQINFTLFWDSSQKVMSALEDAANNYHTLNSAATDSTMGASYSGTVQWEGGVLGSDGKIYGIPYDATNILIIDPIAGTATNSTMGSNLNTGVSKWTGGVLGPDGKIYAIPSHAQDILIIDPIAGTATRSNMGANFSYPPDTLAQWYGGVLGPDGKIYGIPYDATDILIIDPIAGTADRSSMGVDLSDGRKWIGGVLAPNGKIYTIPSHAQDILIIDPIAGTADRSSMGASLNEIFKWNDGVLGPDGKIYGIPLSSSTILIIDPILGTATRSNMGADLSNSFKWSKGTLGPDGKIYGIPLNSSTILIIDPIAGTAARSSMGGSLTGSSKWSDGILGPDGKIYGIPLNSSTILIIDKHEDVSALPLNTILSPHF